MADDDDKQQQQIVDQLQSMFDNLPPERLAAILAAARNESQNQARPTVAWPDASVEEKIEALKSVILGLAANAAHLLEFHLQTSQAQAKQENGKTDTWAGRPGTAPSPAEPHTDATLSPGSIINAG